jgi:hypothetical protein
VTFRQEDSLPQVKLRELQCLKEEWERQNPPPRSQQAWEDFSRTIMALHDILALDPGIKKHGITWKSYIERQNVINDFHHDANQSRIDLHHKRRKWTRHACGCNECDQSDRYQVRDTTRVQKRKKRDFSLKTPAHTQILPTWRNPQHMSLPFMNLRRNPSLQNTRFLLQTCFLGKLAAPSRHSLAFRAHRHRLSAFARKKMYARTQRNSR